MTAPGRALYFTIAALMTLGSLLAPVGSAAAETASPSPPVQWPPGVVVEAILQLRLAPDGPGQVAVTLDCHGLPSGPVAWTPSAASGALGAQLPTDLRLTDPLGNEVAVAAAGGGNVEAELPWGGDWTLGYSLPATGLSGSGLGLVVRPADLVLLPGPATEVGLAAAASSAAMSLVKVSVSGPEGWWVGTGAPEVAARGLPSPWLGLLSFQVAPAAPPELAALAVGGATVRVYGSEELAADEPALAAVASACDAYLERFSPPGPGEAHVFLGPAAGRPTAAAAQAMDSIWLLQASSAAGAASLGPADLAFIATGLWPLARHGLLLGAGLGGEADLAIELWEQSRAYADLAAGAASADSDPTRAWPSPVAEAPLVMAYFLAAAEGGSPEALLERALGGLFSPATLAGDLAVAGRLPELPESILALADPDTDGDGLPDRLDPEPAVKGVSVVVGGLVVRWDVAPAFLDGRIFVPLRFLAERLGAAVAWDETARRALVERVGRQTVFPTDCPWYIAGGSIVYTGTATRVIGGRTLIPLRFAAMALDVFVDWDQATLTALADPYRPYPPSPDALVGGTGSAVPPPGGGDLVAYLTFDDGPNPEMTPRVLDVLAEKGAPATFFVIGFMAQRWPDILRRIVAGGHALGNHTYSHNLTKDSPGWVYRSPEAYLEELAACGAAVSTATGFEPRATRPPGGSYPYLTQDFMDALTAAGYSTYDWDISAADSASPRPTAAQIVARIAGAASGRPHRLIVLMHDGGGDHETTLAALPAVIDALRALGYSFAVLTG